MFISIRGSLFDLTRPRVMGIINVTDNSFYEGSRHMSEKSVLETAALMIDQGADILDIGGCSTRPGSDPVDIEVEMQRVKMAVETIRKHFPGSIISVDTWRASIAEEAVLSFGADIINDISAGEMDRNMLPLVERLNVPYILMHMQGKPATMQRNPVYNDVISDLLMWFGNKLEELKQRGVKDIIIDPGFGFGKTVDQNFEILQGLDSFSITGLPILIGLSRKTTIWKTLGISPDDALNGTTALNMAALMKGANILRVHDVKEARETVLLFEKMYPDGISFMHYC
jgi:dihydropteroate synthase